MPTDRKRAPLMPEPGSPRARLLDAADVLFYGQGIRNTGVDAILDHAQVARKTLYHQFGGKDGLTVAYLRARDERWSAHWLAAIDRRTDPVERLLAIFDALETWEPGESRPRACAFIDATVELADPTHPAAEVVGAHWDAMTSRLTALANEARLDDPDAVVEDLLLIYRGVLITLMVEPVSRAVERGRDLARRTLRHGGP